ncbi:MAG TPA: 2-amino-4-hydroxy-6-hydroxymethyldihydropteridine diphosphokinase [Chryseolinea sp.]|nr:2-amino-4-hydroxy-6-hydroxymethyldihydropteridine diphosphokinase [Chryseolinea sp.]
MNNRIFLLLGTNLGDRKINLELAIDEIEKLVGAIVTKSSIYKTAAWGKLDQPEFYNQVVEVDTKINGLQILEKILGIEISLGRERKEKWGERLIDIDILLIGDRIIQSEKLVVPHPQLANRKFTLIPLAEIASDVVRPILNKSIAELLEECVDPLEVYKLE